MSPRQVQGIAFHRFYDELRALAGYHLGRERADHTLQPTALVHEAFLRLARQQKTLGEERVKFLSVASDMIRRILVDHARQRNAAKRSGRRNRVEFAELSIPEWSNASVPILDLDAALDDLRTLNERQAEVVQLRFFAGLSVAETAEALGVSEGSVKGDWRIARAWLRVRLGR